VMKEVVLPTSKGTKLIPKRYAHKPVLYKYMYV
jgi:hypothetical protein